MTKSFLVRSKGWAKIAQTDYAQNEGIGLGMKAPPGGHLVNQKFLRIENKVV